MYRNPDLPDKIFPWLLTVIAKVQYMNSKVSFLFVGDVNDHQEEWLGSSTYNLYGRAARDLASSLGCKQMVTDPTHIVEGVLDIGKCSWCFRIRVGSPVETSDNSATGSPVETSDNSATFIDVVV